MFWLYTVKELCGIEFQCKKRLWYIAMTVNLNAQSPRTLELQQLWET